MQGSFGNVTKCSKIADSHIAGNCFFYYFCSLPEIRLISDMRKGSSKLMYYVYAFMLLIFAIGCTGREDEIVYTEMDLQESKIAVLNNAIGEEDLKELFSHAKEIHFKSSSEFLLALAIGKCDAGITTKSEGIYLMNTSEDYEFLRLTSSCDSVKVIVHKRVHPVRSAEIFENDFLEESRDRIKRSLLTKDYLILIVNGLAVTLIIFILGVVLALLLAAIMTWMNHQKALSWISRPVSYFVRTIHDVPSVVLIFFFYYIVFASVHISGVIVCVIALGVYSSGSFMNIFDVHLNQVDRTQHQAAYMLGFRGWKKYRYVILPQAVKPMLPLVVAESKVLLRATSFAGYISQLDLIKVTEIIRNQTYDILVPLLFVSCIFLLISKVIVDGYSYLFEKVFKYD